MTFNIKQDNLRISTRAGKLQGSVGAWGRSIKHGDHTWSGSSSRQAGSRVKTLLSQLTKEAKG